MSDYKDEEASWSDERVKEYARIATTSFLKLWVTNRAKVPGDDFDVRRRPIYIAELARRRLGVDK